MLFRFVMSMVALKRIEKYLSEEEVPEYVSSLMRAAPSPHEPVDMRLGCAAATFRWPAAPSDDADKDKNKKKSGVFAKIGAAWSALTGLISRVLVLLRLKKQPGENTDKNEQAEEQDDKPFELRDVSVVFPEGVISLVCGPTGSGKSSREWGLFCFSRSLGGVLMKISMCM
jgi:ABC-type multidrug transport system fused ATPase/permease subunit